MELVKGKTKTAAWFYSVEGVASNRVDLYKRLKNIIDIDIYGKNQTLTCPPYPARCLKDAGKIYKFYLAFENALCEDYLTEKAFRAIEDNMVPVIYSGVDLSNFLPPRSYINANSFETVEDLGEYLKFLSENDNEYLKYFWWKKFYEIKQTSLNFCEICRALNKLKAKTKRKTVESIQEFYFVDKCHEPKIQF
jgi:alpha-1,3-fucosyltransferase